jgi:hypothetical protein
MHMPAPTGILPRLSLHASVLLACGCGPQEVVAETALEVYEGPEPPFCLSCKRNTVLVVLRRGERPTLLREFLRGKSVLVFEVRLRDGRQGYVFHSGGRFRIERAALGWGCASD